MNWHIEGITQDDINDSIVDFSFKDTDVSFGYLQSDFGFNFWFSETFAWNIHAKLWTFFDDDIESSSSIIPGTVLIFEF